jgi:hypothetical protein
VDGDAHHRIDRRVPRTPLQNPHRVRITGLPTGMNAGAGEVDVAQMILVIESRRFEANDVHESAAAVARHLRDGRRCTLLFRHQPDQFADDMTELMDVLLPRDMAVGAARIVIGLIDRRTIADSLAEVGGGTLEQLIATSIVGLLILIPFFAFRALGEVVGERNLIRVFFAPRYGGDNK